MADVTSCENGLLIDYFPISLNILCLPPKFCTGIVFKCFWENAVLQGAFENSGSCKFFFFGGAWGVGGGGRGNRVYFGGFTNREFLLHT